MDWSSVLIGLGSAASALGLSEVIRTIVNKWVNKKKEAVGVQADIADLEAKDIVNREKMFATLSKINDKLMDEIADLTQSLIGARSQVSEVINNKLTLTMENGELKVQNESLKTQNELLRMENEQLRKTLGELKEKLSKMEAKIKKLEKKI
jgi:regulator of replication initiation timing